MLFQLVLNLSLQFVDPARIDLGFPVYEEVDADARADHEKDYVRGDLVIERVHF